MLFVWVVSVAVTVLSVINAVLSEGVFGVIPITLGEAVLYTLFSALLVIAIDALVALLIRRALPEKWFNHKKSVFSVSVKEKRFYESVKIRRWKDKIPEWGKFTGFSKNEIAKPQDNEYLDKYFLELCYGEVIHFISVFAGFAVLLATSGTVFFTVGLPVAIINAFCNLPSLFILRYNSYKLEVLYKNNEKRAMRESVKNAPVAFAAESVGMAETVFAEGAPVQGTQFSGK